MTRYAFYFNSAICTGCKTCQVACKESHGLPLGVIYRKVFDVQGGSWLWDDAMEGYYANGIFGYFVSIACNHCKEPACMAACPNGVISKDETGVVTICDLLCEGCGTCVGACPYHAITLSPSHGHAMKCDMCASDIAAGKKPLCVRSCKMRCLDWGDFDELTAKYGKGNVEIAPLPLDTTGPSLVFNPHPEARPSGSQECTIVSLEEEYQ